VADALVGALAATTVFVVLGRPGEHRYAINVFLTHEVTADQRAAIDSALRTLHPVDGVRFEDREQAWQHFKETFKDQPDLIARSSADAMPESFRLTTKGTEFDCRPLARVKQLAGVDQIQVPQQPANGHPGAVVGCGYSGPVG
jgi:cell division transport system permease protein